MKDVVLCSLEPWDDVWRRNQYLVSELLADDPSLRVLFVAPPVDRWSLAGWSEARSTRVVPHPGIERLWELRPVKPLPRVAGPLADLTIRHQVLRGASSLGMGRPVFWVNDVHAVNIASFAGWPAVYDITDDWLVEDSVPARVRRRRARLEARALERCREVVVCSPSLERSRGGVRPVRLVRNGVDDRLMTMPRARPTDLPDGRTAVYVGTVQTDRFDVDLLIETAQANDDLNVVLVGPVHLGDVPRQRLEAQSNIVLLGPRAHEDVPAYLQNADVVVVPHLVNRFTESLDPIKAYECLALAVPTVATPVAGFRDRTGPIHTATREEFAEAVRNAVGRPVEPALPRDATWSGRASEFREVLDVVSADRR